VESGWYWQKGGQSVTFLLAHDSWLSLLARLLADPAVDVHQSPAMEKGFYELKENLMQVQNSEG